MPEKRSQFLHNPPAISNRIYTTENGEAWAGDAKRLLKKVPDNSVDLVFTSPPYALLKKKEYGNEAEDKYIEWFRPFAHEIFRILKDTGSFVLNVGGAWKQGSPTRSLYVFKLLLDLCEPDSNRKDAPQFHLAQEFFWFNPAKMPNPAQWVTIDRVRVKDAVEYVWWLSKTPHPRADNTAILGPYSKSMERLLKTDKYNRGRRPSGWQVSDDWAINHGGSIPPNMLPVDLVTTPHDDPVQGMNDQLNMFVEANTSSNDLYRRRTREAGFTAHPAMFPKALPEFFIRFLTKENDIVIDPFAGSNTTGKAADDLSRNWLAFEKERKYLKASRLRWNTPPKNGA